MRLSRLHRLLGAVAAAALVVSPVLGQGPNQGGGARPAPIPKSGPVPREPAVEAKLREDVKAPNGFSLTLFAGPPVAMYPICLAESPDGALFVCVDPNLSLSVNKGVGRVMRLVDDDGDGRADRYTTFAEMDSPRGVVFDGKTLYVMHPPNLTAYRDTNGDGISDSTWTVVEGLGFDLDFRGADHTTNNIAMGADGWIYVAVGDYGFRKAVGTDGTQISHRGGAVVRVRPDGTNLEIYATGTRNIFDVAIDPFLHVFARDNTNDGDGWDTRLHYLAPGADMGYPWRYQNFPTEHFPSMHDYGAGAGVGDLWIQDPALPNGYGNTLYTGDWTVNKIFRHPLTAKGAGYVSGQEEFLSVVRPSDFVVDGRSNIYVASLSGGQFTYATDTVGYVFRVSYTGAAGSAAGARSGGAAPSAELPNGARLLADLASGNAVIRLHAQQELVRRGDDPTTVRALERLATGAQGAAEVRVAALFALKQIVGARANAAAAQVAADPDARLREAGLRVLTDRRDQLAGVSSALFVKALADPDLHVQAQAIAGLVRLGAADAAAAIAPLAESGDQALSHLAVSALVSLGARDATLRALDTGTPAARSGALRALAMMHEGPVAAALLDRLGRATDASTRRPLLRTLARLYNREGVWTGDWWTTRPAHLGPYFDPAPWEASPQIRTALSQALVSASGDEMTGLVTDLALNQVLPRGAAPLLLAVSAAKDPQRAAVIDALVGHRQLDAPALAVVGPLDAKSPALHAAVAQLLAGESVLGAGTLPLIRTAVLDTKMDAAIRGQLLTALTGIPGRAGLDAASEIFARLNPAAAPPNAAPAAMPTPPAGSAPPNGMAGADPVETAWRRYVGDRRRIADVDYFIEMARTGPPAGRTLAYAVLVQSVRSQRVPQALRDKVGPVLDAAWSDPASTPSLVQAITLMRLESQYAEKLQAAGKMGRP